MADPRPRPFDDDQRSAHAFCNPPAGSRGFTLDIGNPYGEPKRFVLDLGK